MVVDANGVVLGPYLRDSGQDFVIMRFGGINAAFPFTRSGIFGDNAVYWTGPNCTGSRFGRDMSSTLSKGARHDRTIVIQSTVTANIGSSQGYQSIEHLNGDTPNTEWNCVNSNGTAVLVAAVDLMTVDVASEALPVAPLRVQ